ncbi:MAG: T9SS type A sorting domain-containing protein [Saprospiraceae bacterium]
MNCIPTKNRLMYSAILLCMAIVASGQVELSLTKTSSNDVLYQCYQINLINLAQSEASLAGQNYRLYYSTDGVSLDESSITSMLPDSYLPLKLVQHHHNVDASGFGVLTYDNNLGFINLATDYHLTSNKPLVLKHGVKNTVATLCFDVIEGKEPQFTWAQDHLTQTYATAFNEIALLNGSNLSKGKITEYRVQTGSITATQQPSVMDVSYFPNPFTQSLTIDFNMALKEDATLMVYDLFGTKVRELEVLKGSTSITIDGQNLENGAYTIAITQADGQKSSLKAIKIK